MKLFLYSYIHRIFAKKEWFMGGDSRKVKLEFFNPKSINLDLTTKIEGVVSAGFPSPAGDYIDQELNLKELLIRNESSTFFVRVSGTSMVEAGIFDGDILVVDKSIEPYNNSILVCFVDGEFTVKKVEKKGKDLYLIPENPKFKPIKIDKNSDFRLWGVVTFAIHKFR